MIRALLAAGLALAGLVGAGPAPAVTHRQLTWAGVEVHALRVAPVAEVRPVAARPRRTVPGFAREAGAIAAVNGGYFNHSDGFPVSHVLIDGEPRTRPRENRALTGSAALAPYLGRIFDHRVEWRRLEGAEARWAIAPHAAPPPPGARIVHALQAGPALLPSLGLEAEAFVRRDARGRLLADGIASSARAARSAVGLTPEGAMWLVATAGHPKRSTGLTILQLRDLMAHLGAERAMALDGGSSTTLVWREGDRLRTFTGSGEGPARVNSALVVTGPADGKMAP